MKHERMVLLARECVVTKPVLFVLPLGHKANCEDGGCAANLRGSEDLL